jgi:hypothetical protein
MEARTMRTLALVTLAALALAGCGEREKKADSGTGVAVWDDGKPAEAAAGSGEKGKFAMSLPGFDLKMDLPKAMFDKSDFEIDGVKLYPGSRITAMAIAKAKDAKDDADTNVDIAFTAPADPETVRAYFVEKLGDKLSTTAAGAPLAGTTDDGDAFTIELAPGPGGSTGKVRLTS